MIIGNGLVANTFNCFKNNQDFLIFASGVSNSKEIRKEVFCREKNTLLEALKANNNRTFIYFSSSLVNNRKCTSDYAKHKRAMEFLVSKHERHYIFRLPNLVGKTNNPYTLTNFLYYKLIHNEQFSIWDGAYRNLLDVDDLLKMVIFVIEREIYLNQTLELNNTEDYSILEIIDVFERVLDKKAHFKIEKNEGNTTYNKLLAYKILQFIDISFDEFYLLRLVGKYYAERS